MSKIRPSPIRAEIQRCHSDSPASAIARTTSTIPTSTMKAEFRGRIPSSMIAR